MCFIDTFSAPVHTGREPLPTLYCPLCLFIACSDLSSTLVSCSFTFYSVYVSFPSAVTDFSLDVFPCVRVPLESYFTSFCLLEFLFYFFLSLSLRIVTSISFLLLSPYLTFLVFLHLLFCMCVRTLPSCTSIPPSHFCVSPPVGAGCVRRPSSVSLTCRSTPSRTQRPNLTSVLTAPSHSPTPATWPSTSVSTVGPSLTPAPTARNLSGSSVIYSSTHGTAAPPNPHPAFTNPHSIFPVLLTCPAKSLLDAQIPVLFLIGKKGPVQTSH